MKLINKLGELPLPKIEKIFLKNKLMNTLIILFIFSLLYGFFQLTYIVNNGFLQETYLEMNGFVLSNNKVVNIK